MKQKAFNFIDSVNATIRRYRMLAPGDKVLIAVSGGPDSVALVHALAELRYLWRMRLVIAHLNHGLRQEAADEAAFVEDLAGSLGIPCETGFADVKTLSKQHHFSIQEGARKARYRFLQSAGTKHNAQKIAMGHHADDNAESVLINLLRGTGPRGMTGIPPVRENLFIRPLIEIPRKHIMTFLHRKNLPFKTDISNVDPKYLRNRVRHELIPFLEKHFSGECVSRLNRLASVMRIEEDFWNPVVKKAFDAHVIHAQSDCIILETSGLTEQHPAVARRLVRHTIFLLTGTLKGISHNHVQATLCLAARNHPSGIVRLAHGVYVIRDRKKTIFQLGEPEPVPPFEYTIATPSTFAIPEIAVALRLSTCPVEKVRDEVQTVPPTTALFDLKTLAFPLIVRNFRPGDRFAPLGLSGSQKLKSFFINNKISRWKRMAYPLLLSKGHIIWVGGLRISEQAKLTPDTEQVLRVDLLSRQSV